MKIDNSINLTYNVSNKMKHLAMKDAKRMERLSSGLRINRAADDAAGLFISEKLRSQIRGLRMASRNAQDGISVVQTAEGAMDEISSILQRMRELSVKSANDTNRGIDDRFAMQQEVNQLSDEIERITERTEFNNMKLLDGTLREKYLQTGANILQTMRLDIGAVDLESLTLSKGSWERIKDEDYIPEPGKPAGGGGAPAKPAVLEVGVSDVGGTAGQTQTIKVNINGTDYDVELKAGDNTQDIANRINAAIGGAGKAEIVGGKLKITSTSAGEDSKVSVTRPEINATTGGIAVPQTTVPGTDYVPGKPGVSAVLKMDISAVGSKGYQEISVTVDGTTFDNIILTSDMDEKQIASAINNKIKSLATATIDPGTGKLVITSKSKKATSSVSVVRAEVSKIDPGTGVTQGTATGRLATSAKAEISVSNLGTSGYQEIKVSIDGGAAKTVRIDQSLDKDGNGVVSANEIYNKIKSDLGSTAKVDFDGSKITIESKKTGSASKVNIEKVENTATGGIAISGNVSGTGVKGVDRVDAKPAEVKVNIDDIGTDGYQEITISITNSTVDSKGNKTGSNTDKYDIRLTAGMTRQKIAETIQTAIGSKGTAKIVNEGGVDKLVITSSTDPNYMNAHSTISLVRNPAVVSPGGIANDVSKKGTDGTSAKTTIKLSDIKNGYQEIKLEIDGQKITQDGNEIIKLKDGMKKDEIAAELKRIIGAKADVSYDSATGDLTITSKKTGVTTSTIKLTKVKQYNITGGITTDKATGTGENAVPAKSATTTFAVESLGATGYQEIDLSIDGVLSGSTLTPNSATHLRLESDGGMLKASVGSTVLGTYTNDAEGIKSALQAALSGKATVTRNGNDITVTSNSAGSTSYVGVKKVAQYNTVGGIGRTNTFTDQGEDATAAVLEVAVKDIQGGSGRLKYTVTINGTTTKEVILTKGMTEDDIEKAFANALAGEATVDRANPTDGKLRITSATAGSNSKVEISAPTLIDELTNGVKEESTAVTGTTQVKASLKTTQDVGPITGEGSQTVKITYDGRTYTAVLDKTTTDIAGAIAGAKDGAKTLSEVATVSIGADKKLYIEAKEAKEGASFGLETSSLNVGGGIKDSTVSTVEGKTATAAVAKLAITDIEGKQGEISYTFIFDNDNNKKVTIKVKADSVDGKKTIDEIAKEIDDVLKDKHYGSAKIVGGKLHVTSGLTGTSSSVEVIKNPQTNSVTGGVNNDVNKTEGYIPKFKNLEFSFNPITSDAKQHITLKVTASDGNGNATPYDIEVDIDKNTTLTTLVKALNDEKANKMGAQANQLQIKEAGGKLFIGFDPNVATATDNPPQSLEIIASKNDAKGGINSHTEVFGTTGVNATLKQKITNIGGQSGRQTYTIKIQDGPTAAAETFKISVKSGTPLNDIVTELQNATSASGKTLSSLADVSIVGGELIISRKEQIDNAAISLNVKNESPLSGGLNNATFTATNGVTNVDPVTAKPAEIKTDYVLQELKGEGTQTFAVIVNNNAQTVTLRTRLQAGQYKLTANQIVEEINGQITGAKAELDAQGKLVIRTTNKGENEKIALDLKPQDTSDGVTEDVIGGITAGYTDKVKNPDIDPATKKVTGKDATNAQVSLEYTKTSGTTGYKSFKITLNEGNAAKQKEFTVSVKANTDRQGFVDAINEAYKKQFGEAKVIAKLDTENPNNIILSSDYAGKGSKVEVKGLELENVTQGGLIQEPGKAIENSNRTQDGTDAKINIVYATVNNLKPDNLVYYELGLGDETHRIAIRPKKNGGTYSVTGDMLIAAIKDKIDRDSKYKDSFTITNITHSMDKTFFTMHMKSTAGIDPSITLRQLDAVPLGMGEGIGARRAKTEVMIMDTKGGSNSFYNVKVNVNGRTYEVTGRANETLDQILKNFQDVLGDVANVSFKKDKNGNDITYKANTWSNSVNRNIEKDAKTLVIESKDATEDSIVSVSRGPNNNSSGGMASGCIPWDTVVQDTVNKSRDPEYAVIRQAYYKNGQPSLLNKTVRIYIDGKVVVDGVTLKGTTTQMRDQLQGLLGNKAKVTSTKDYPEQNGNDIMITSSTYGDKSQVRIVRVARGWGGWIEKEDIGAAAYGTDFKSPAVLKTVINDIPARSQGQKFTITIDGVNTEIELYDPNGEEITKSDIVAKIKTTLEAKGLGTAEIVTEGGVDYLQIKSSGSTYRDRNGVEKISYVQVTTPPVPITTGKGLVGENADIQGIKVVVGPSEGKASTAAVYLSKETVKEVQGRGKQFLDVVIDRDKEFEVSYAVNSRPEDIADAINNTTNKDGIKFSDVATAEITKDTKASFVSYDQYKYLVSREKQTVNITYDGVTYTVTLDSSSNAMVADKIANATGGGGKLSDVADVKVSDGKLIITAKTVKDGAKFEVSTRGTTTAGFGNGFGFNKSGEVKGKLKITSKKTGTSSRVSVTLRPEDDVTNGIKDGSETHDKAKDVAHEDVAASAILPNLNKITGSDDGFQEINVIIDGKNHLVQLKTGWGEKEIFEEIQRVVAADGKVERIAGGKIKITSNGVDNGKKGSETSVQIVRYSPEGGITSDIAEKSGESEVIQVPGQHGIATSSQALQDLNGEGNQTLHITITKRGNQTGTAPGGKPVYAVDTIFDKDIILKSTADRSLSKNDIVNQINSELNGAGVASIDASGKLVIRTADDNMNEESSVNVTVTNPAGISGGIAEGNFDSSNGVTPRKAELSLAYSAVTSASGSGVRNINVRIDGKDHFVMLGTGDSIDKVIEKIKASVGADGTVEKDADKPGNIKITSATYGSPNSKLEILDVDIAGGLSNQGPVKTTDDIAAEIEVPVTATTGEGEKTVTVNVSGTEYVAKLGSNLDINGVFNALKSASSGTKKLEDVATLTLDGSKVKISTKETNAAKERYIKLTVNKSDDIKGGISETGSYNKDIDGKDLVNTSKGTGTLTDVRTVGGAAGDYQELKITLNAGTADKFETKVIKLDHNMDINAIKDAINAALKDGGTVKGTADIVGNNIVITSAKEGNGSSVEITKYKANGGVESASSAVSGVEGKPAVWTSKDALQDLTGEGTQKVSITIDGVKTVEVELTSKNGDPVTAQEIKDAINAKFAANGNIATASIDAGGKLVITTKSKETTSSISVTVSTPNTLSEGAASGSSTKDATGVTDVIDKQNAKLELNVDTLQKGSKQEFTITTSNGSKDIILDAGTSEMNINAIATAINNQAGGLVTADATTGKLVIKANDTAGSSSSVSLKFLAGNNATGGITGDHKATGKAEIPAKVARLETPDINDIGGTGKQEIRITVGETDNSGNYVTGKVSSKDIVLDMTKLTDKSITGIAGFIDKEIDGLGLDAKIEGGKLVITSRQPVTGANRKITLTKLPSNNGEGGIKREIDEKGTDYEVATAKVAISDLTNGSQGLKISIDGVEKTLYFDKGKTADDIKNEINTLFGAGTADIQAGELIVRSTQKGETANVNIKVMTNNGSNGLAKGTDKSGNGVTKVDFVAEEHAKIELAGAQISKLQGNGKQELSLDIDGKHFDIVLEVNGVLSESDIAAAINGKISSVGTATWDSANKKLIIASKGIAKKGAQSTITLKTVETNNATGGVTADPTKANAQGVDSKSSTLVTDVSQVKGKGKQEIEITLNGTKKFKVVLNVGDDKQEIVNKINAKLGSSGSARIIPTGEPNAGKLEIVNKLSATGASSSTQIEILPGNTASGGIGVGTYPGDPGKDPEAAKQATYAKSVIDPITTIGGTGKQQVKVTIDGSVYDIILRTGMTEDQIASTINKAISDKGRAYLEGNKLVVQSKTAGAASTVTVERVADDPNINKATGGFAVGSAEAKGKRSVPKYGEVDIDWRGINILTREKASKSITIVDGAIGILSDERSRLGAVQNRLEHTIKNLDNSAENMTAAESRIRDADIAKELSMHIKNTILAQAQMAMQVHSRILAENVLQLYYHGSNDSKRA